MAKLNKITKLYNAGTPLTECAIQTHIDVMNADGWELVYPENMGGWYRFYWSKESV